MSAINFELQAELRDDEGKGASRRLRRSGKVPAIVYGGHEAPTSITLEHHKVIHALANAAFYTHILNVSINGKKQDMVLKAVQRHPYKKAVLHLDFQRVSATESIQMRVPLHFENADKAQGVKKGGLISHLLNDVEVRCLARHLPEYLSVDLSHLDLEQSLHLSDLVLPTGVTLVAFKQGQEHDLPIVSIHLPRAAKEEPVAAPAPAAAVPASMAKEAKDNKK